MKIAVIGAGGVGGYFGARLAQAGHDVRFLARGRHLAAMRDRGLRIDSPSGAFVLERPQASDDPLSLRGTEIVLVTTKLWDLAQTARQIAPAVGESTVVVPFQNGVDAVDLLGEAIPRERIAAGVAYIAATIGEPGVIAHTGGMARLRVGALAPAQRPVLRAFVEAGQAAGFGCEEADDAPRMLWEKFVFLNALSAVTAVTRQAVEAVRTDADLRATFQAVVREGIALAGRSGVDFPAGHEAAQMQFLDTLPPTMRASMAHDLLAGHRLEAPWLCGAVARRAAAVGLDVPVNRTIWAALKPFAGGATPG
jgi:2-dehydropantoate 2-reductase